MEREVSSVQHWIVPADQAGRRVDHVLGMQHPGVPQSHWYRLLRRGEVRVNRHRIQPGYHVQEGDVVRIPPIESRERAPLARTSFSDSQKRWILGCILYEDARGIVLNKPSGLAVHGGSQVTVDVLSLLRSARGDLESLPTLELVHRLDRETSGCLILAKTHRALREIQEQFREGKVVKTYWTLTAGHWPAASQRVELSLGKHETRGKDHRIEVCSTGQRAVTDFQVLESFRGAQWMRVGLHTGRTHQIRVHASAEGHPVAGDDKYGDRTFNREMKGYGLRRLFLHAYQISLTLGSGSVTLTAPLEDSLASVLGAMRKGGPC